MTHNHLPGLSTSWKTPRIVCPTDEGLFWKLACILSHSLPSTTTAGCGRRSRRTALTRNANQLPLETSKSKSALALKPFPQPESQACPDEITSKEVDPLAQSAHPTLPPSRPPPNPFPCYRYHRPRSPRQHYSMNHCRHYSAFPRRLDLHCRHFIHPRPPACSRRRPHLRH